MCIKAISLKLIYKIDLSNCFIKSNSTKFKFISFKFIPPDQIQPNSNFKFIIISLKLIYKFPAHRTSTQDQHTGPAHRTNTRSTHRINTVSTQPHRRSSVIIARLALLALSTLATSWRHSKSFKT